MNRLTIDETIQHAHQLWAHIAETGDTKSETVKHLINVKQQSHLAYLSHNNAYCPLCAYAKGGGNIFTDYCTRCPAASMWVKGNPEATCASPDAPYNSAVMLHGSTSSRRIVGAKMIDLIMKVANKHDVTL